MNRKHYFKMADYLGTFKFHLEQHLKENSNHTDWQEKEELINPSIDYVVNVCRLIEKLSDMTLDDS